MERIEKLARAHGTGGWQTLEDMVRFGNAVADEEGFVVLKTMLEVFDIMADPEKFRAALAAAVAKRVPSNAGYSAAANTEKE